MSLGVASSQAADDQAQALVLRELVDSFWLGVGLFDEDARLIYSNQALGDLNPALTDILAPGLEWDRLLIEWVARGVMDRKAQQCLRESERKLIDNALARETSVVEMRGLGFHEILLVATSNGGFALVQRNVTRREMASEDDQEADAILRQVMEACPANLLMSRMDDGQIIYRSPAAREVLGPGKKLFEHFAKRSDLADFVTEILPQGRIDDLSILLKNTDGATFPALVSARLIEYRGEDVAVSSIVDITKEVEMRRMLAAQRERIFETEKLSALGELLAGVAHELNNPLSVVVGHALMLREQTDDPDILRRVEQIENAADRCARIVKSFLAMAREQGVDKQLVELRDVLDRAVHGLREGEMDFTIAVNCNLPATLPPLSGDPAQLEQVFTNLLVNSQQAIGKSGIGGRVDIAAKLDRNRSLVVIDICDDGPGIPPHIGKRVFEPLFTTKEVGQGTGIGLAFCHRVLTAHGGSIELIASDGGAHFRVHLPLGQERKEVEPMPGPTEAGSRQGHVLVVDDEQDVAALIAEILRRDGYDVAVANSAEDGLVACAGSQFDAILVDIKMPGLGGQGFLQRILEDRPWLVDRIAFVTGSTMSPETRGFLDNSGCRFLEKPVAPADVRALTAQLVEGNR